MINSLLNSLRGLVYYPAYKEGGSIADFEPAVEPWSKIMNFMKGNNTDFMCGTAVTFVDFIFFEMSQFLVKLLPEKVDSQELQTYMKRIQDMAGFSDKWADDKKCMKMPFTAAHAWIGRTD